MTEPGAGADPTLIATTAQRDGEEWVINGHKWFTSNGSVAELPDRHVRDQPRRPPVRGLLDDHRAGRHSRGGDGPRHLDDGGPDTALPQVRRPHRDRLHEMSGCRRGTSSDAKETGSGSLRCASVPGRIHHCMRWLGQSQRAFDMLCERAVSRRVHGSLLADKQMVQSWVADSMAEMTAARLMTLQAAWKIDRDGAPAARVEIAMIKYFGATVLYNVIDRAIQAHGSLGFSTDLPLEHMYRAARAARIYDGPDEVHKVTVARQILKNYKPVDVPTEHVPTRRKAAEERFAEMLQAATAAQ